MEDMISFNVLMLTGSVQKVVGWNIDSSVFQEYSFWYVDCLYKILFITEFVTVGTGVLTLFNTIIITLYNCKKDHLFKQLIHCISTFSYVNYSLNMVAATSGQRPLPCSM